MSKGTGPLSKLYNVIILSVDKFVPKSAQPLWQSPAGPRTVFFWAPLFKWGLVAAGLGDTLSRPAQNISLNQCGSLAVTGLIWSRYSVVIIPKNYSLLAVNIAVFFIQSFLVVKHLRWRNEKTKNMVYKHPYYPIWSGDDW
ncbi:mitochondrial pyruvate carrier 2-like [Drosophila guanche]|uniref:Mitochondrial pyruvate carrier n=1 Tax=Drosophila guanche TaxID=7266 RepID=A0A3B0JIQ6_DROGU|nr:mitochondrial pyruvate carrier 2-like [Drosophila guanche]SPP82257.1 blast:Mitochondrial pyruvate carrier 2 [Drosophila guanche]